jgi:glycosyltransferase involved in cell wall biosynthesis
MDKISIIVPTYNRKVMLQRLLESFNRLQSHCPLEFIIIDDCSDDGTEMIVETWKDTVNFADVHYHRLPSRSGPARARNAGITLSTGNILAFTDSDCITDPFWIDQLYTQLISNPSFAGAGGHVLPVHQDVYSLYNTVYRILEPPSHINAVIGANCIFWKQPVVDVGMFDDYFFYPGGEEIALCMKLWIRGYRFGFEEHAVIYHDYRQNLKDFIRSFYHYGIGERIILENRLKEYLRYMTYPEQMHNYLAFKNFYVFLLIFIMRVVYGTFRQRTFLGTLQVSKKQKYMLIGLFAIQNFSYHLGRGTFSGRLVRQVQKYSATPSEYLNVPDSGPGKAPYLTSK